MGLAYRHEAGRRGTFTGQSCPPLCPGETANHPGDADRLTASADRRRSCEYRPRFGRMRSVAPRRGRIAIPPESVLAGSFVAGRTACRPAPRLPPGAQAARRERPGGPSSSSHEPRVHLQLLPTPPCGGAVTFGYRPENLICSGLAPLRLDTLSDARACPRPAWAWRPAPGFCARNEPKANR